MSKKSFFFFAPILFLTAFLSHAQEMGLYPLTQYSVGGKSGVQLRTTTTTLPQQDTLKIPYIEDFTGYGLPIDSISVDILPSTELVYRITHLKMHGLKDHDSIFVFNIGTKNTNVSDLLKGTKYVKVLDKYSFQLFNDVALTNPATVLADRIHYFNWIRMGKGGYSATPDTLGFLDNNGGVFINNDMALNPISIGVATFDGVDYRGIPYSTGTTKGYGDNLTSLPFNLSQYNPKDSIYMSFYWQSKSLGDSPLSSEFLSLEFKDTSKTDTWIQVWKKFGNTTIQDTFKIEMIPITDSAYFHESFQYRFRSYGVLNGRFNVWNLDYIYIDTNREASKPFLKDVSIVATSKSALKNYTSVPYKHIRNLPVATIKSETGSAFLTIRDTYTVPADLDPIKRRQLIRDNLDHNTTTNYVKVADSSSFRSDQIFKQDFEDTIPGGFMDAPYVLKEEFSYQPLDTVGPIDMSFNNFTAIETYFYEKYSYDDGIPERAFLSVNAGGTKLANRYKILKGDDLTHIDYCFIRNNGPDMTNTAILLNVWKRDSSAIAPTDPLKLTVVTQQVIYIKYSPDINGFVRYALTTPIQLDSGGTYYFGFTQNSNNALFLGYDRNNDHLDKIFYCNDGTSTWHPFTDLSSVTGALMINPVFSDNEIITRIETKETEQNHFTFYPNPAKSELHFTGQPESISVYDLSGRLLLEKKIAEEEVLSTDTLPNGLYLLTLSKGDYTEVKRLIIQK